MAQRSIRRSIASGEKTRVGLIFKKVTPLQRKKAKINYDRPIKCTKVDPASGEITTLQFPTFKALRDNEEFRSVKKDDSLRAVFRGERDSYNNWSMIFA